MGLFGSLVVIYTHTMGQMGGGSLGPGCGIYRGHRGSNGHGSHG